MGKSFPVSERVNLQLRAEFDNLLNHFRQSGNRSSRPPCPLAPLPAPTFTPQAAAVVVRQTWCRRHGSAHMPTLARESRGLFPQLATALACSHHQGCEI